MPRISLFVLLVLGIVLCLTDSATGERLDSKAWGKISTTTGPPRPGAVEAQRAKLAQQEAIARGLMPLPGPEQGAHALSRALLPSGANLSFRTSRPYTGAELAACEAQIRAKLEAAAHVSPAPRSLVWPGLLPPKPREMSTSVPLEGEALTRSLALERERAAAQRSRPHSAWTPPASHPRVAKGKPPVMRTEIPGTPMNAEQRAKLERARAAEGASTVASPPQDRP